MSRSTLQGKDIKAAAPSAELMYADLKALREGGVDAVMARLIERQKSQRRFLWFLGLYLLVWGALRRVLQDAFAGTFGTFEIFTAGMLAVVGLLMFKGSRDVTRDLEALQRLRDEQRALHRDEAPAAADDAEPN